MRTRYFRSCTVSLYIVSPVSWIAYQETALFGSAFSGSVVIGRMLDGWVEKKKQFRPAKINADPDSGLNQNIQPVHCTLVDQYAKDKSFIVSQNGTCSYPSRFTSKLADWKVKKGDFARGAVQ